MRLLVHGLAGYTKGGIETFVIVMAEHMSDNVIFDYVIETDETGNSLKMPGIGETLMIAPKRNMLSNLKSWSKLLKERKRIDDAVYFNWYSMAWLFPAMLARVYGYKVFIHAHNNNLHNCGFLQKALHAINRQVQKCLKITRLTNSDLSAKFFFGSKPAHMVYNAIDTDRFAFKLNSREKIRSDLNISDKHVYGFAGRIAYQKNPLFLMEIFHEISKRDSEAAFLVCGDGDLFEETKNKSKSLGIDVIFAGSVQNVQDYYQAMDVFLLPSRFEGLGIVLIEAQCSGLPCVVSAEVIPQEAKVTDIVEYIPLKNNPAEWAEEAIQLYLQFSGSDRATYRNIVQNTRFNILLESKELEKILSC